jgi:uracil phosphoribosyltransferase
MLFRPKNPILEELILKLRDPRTERPEFRDAVKNIGRYLGYEIAYTLKKKEAKIRTCMDEVATHYVVAKPVVIVSILRAGNPLCEGLLDVFPKAEVGYIGAERDEKTLIADINYFPLPPVAGKTLIFGDVMLATAGSLIDSIKRLRAMQQVESDSTYIACAIAAKPGIRRVQEYDKQIKIFSAAVDPALNDHGFIKPGLGDAGDRMCGKRF